MFEIVGCIGLFFVESGNTFEEIEKGNNLEILAIEIFLLRRWWVVSKMSTIVHRGYIGGLLNIHEDKISEKVTKLRKRNFEN